MSKAKAAGPPAAVYDALIALENAFHLDYSKRRHECSIGDLRITVERDWTVEKGEALLTAFARGEWP